MRGQSSVLRWFIAACFLLLVGVIAWRVFERQHWLSLIPSDLQVTKILYVQTENFGSGPGGNETGVVLYELPDHVAAKFHGPDVISSWPLSNVQAWKPTPLRDHREWIEGEVAIAQTGPVPVPRLVNFLNQYGFGISIDPPIMDAIDKAISEPGNYYAYTRTGVLFVMPTRRRVAFVYAG